MMVSTDIFTSIAGVTKSVANALTTQMNQDIWGGVGVSSLEWNPIDTHLLAAATNKTQTLEIWDTESGNFVR